MAPFFRFEQNWIFVWEWAICSRIHLLDLLKYNKSLIKWYVVWKQECSFRNSFTSLWGPNQYTPVHCLLYANRLQANRSFNILILFRESGQRYESPFRMLFELFILVMVAIMIISYKGYVLFYVCIARMLKNAFKEWNKWAMEVLNRNQGRISYKSDWIHFTIILP